MKQRGSERLSGLWLHRWLTNEEVKVWIIIKISFKNMLFVWHSWYKFQINYFSGYKKLATLNINTQIFKEIKKNLILDNSRMPLWIPIAVFMPLGTPELSRAFAFMMKGTTIISFLNFCLQFIIFLPMGQKMLYIYHLR